MPTPPSGRRCCATWPRAGRGRRGRARAGRHRRVGRAAAGPAGQRRPVGGRRALPRGVVGIRPRRHPALDRHGALAHAAAAVRGRPGRRPGAHAVALVRDHCHWEHDGQPFFEGEVEPCINGKTVVLGAYFGQDVDGIVERLLGEQLEDGGWNCEAENGSVRSSFPHHDPRPRRPVGARGATGGSAGSIAVRRRGEEYLLERQLFRRKSTGEVVDPDWLRFFVPDALALRRAARPGVSPEAGDPPDQRVDEAIEVLRSKQRPDGTWLLENTHPGAVHFTLEDGDGLPSRWNTLRALRVLGWYERSAG